jgi:hypothetical protein
MRIVILKTGSRYTVGSHVEALDRYARELIKAGIAIPEKEYVEPKKDFVKENKAILEPIEKK